MVSTRVLGSRARLAIGGLLVLVAVAAALLWSSQSAPTDEPATELTETAPPARIPPSASELVAPPPPAAPGALRPVTLGEGRRPNILLFTIDTLRADHLGAYGYDRATSPHLDALAARGTRFVSAYSTASWTLPSMASLVTGVLPSEHGTTQNSVSEEEATQDALSPRLPSLPETLQRAGYHTAGVTGNLALAAFAGFDRGFDEYECAHYATTDDARAPVLAQIERLRAQPGPWFLWVHIMDPHVTYQMREPGFAQWWGEDREPHPELERLLFLRGLDPVARDTGIDRATILEHVLAAYDSEVLAADAFFGEVVDAIADPSLVVLMTADHGEELDDHHRMGHGTTLFDEVTHLPMILAVPGREAEVIETPVQIIDVFPTFAEIAGVRAEGVSGLSLLSATEGEEPPVRDLLLESGRRFLIQGIVAGRYRYGEVVDRPEISRLYDVSVDPHEREDLRAAEPALTESLRERLRTGVAAARARRPEVEVLHVPLADDLAAQLRAIGYGN